MKSKNFFYAEAESDVQLTTNSCLNDRHPSLWGNHKLYVVYEFNPELTL